MLLVQDCVPQIGLNRGEFPLRVDGAHQSGSHGKEAGRLRGAALSGTARQAGQIGFRPWKWYVKATLD